MHRMTRVAALCVCAFSLSACNRHTTTSQQSFATTESSTTYEPAYGGSPGEVETISVALHTGSNIKYEPDPITVRVLSGSQVVGARAVGFDERWLDGSVRALEIPLTSSVSLNQVGALRLEVSRSDSGSAGDPWSAQVEALALLSDGRVVRVLGPTAPETIGGLNDTGHSWALAPQ